MFRPMLRLALVAMLLMSIAPVVSRLLAANGSAHEPVLMEICTSSGLKLIDVSPFIGTEAPEMSAHGAIDTACGYCLLATPLPLLLLALLILTYREAEKPRFRGYDPFLGSHRNRRGIGSRGPPLAL